MNKEIGIASRLREIAGSRTAKCLSFDWKTVAECTCTECTKTKELLALADEIEGEKK